MNFNVTVNRDMFLPWIGQRPDVYYANRYYEVPRSTGSIDLEYKDNKQLTVRIGLIKSNVIKIAPDTNQVKIDISKPLSYMNIVIFGLLMLFMVLKNIVEYNWIQLVVGLLVYAGSLIGYTRYLRNGDHLKVIQC